MPLLFIALLAFLVAFMLFKTFALSKGLDAVKPVEKSAIDTKQVSWHLSQLIQFKSISAEGKQDSDKQLFLDIHDWIEKTFPKIDANLERTKINQYSLLYKWQGTDANLSPVLFYAHQDVVPVDEDTLPSWKVEPFSGTIREGYVWGRGAIDMKGQAVSLLESVEGLLREGFTPKRTIYIALGHDEEIMGFEGAKKIVEHLRAQGVKLGAILDEGGFISSGLLPGSSAPFALLGYSEKGYLTVKISATGSVGHSSQPPRQTAVGIVARAIALLDDHPFPATVDYFLPSLKRIALLLPFSMQFVIANSWLFKKVLMKQLSKSPQMNAMLRTTHAATMINGGIKDNVLPSRVTAKVNLRLLPGDTIDSAIAYIKKVIDDPRVDVEIDEENGGWEASKVSSIQGPAYLSLELVTRQVFDNVTVAPFVFPAGSDSRHFQPICDNIFKFSPIMLTGDELAGMHGINERISQKSLVDMIAFYMRIMRVWGEAEF